MPVNFEIFRHSVNNFNEKYKVRFSLKDFESLAAGGNANKNALNNAYKTVLESLYNQMALNVFTNENTKFFSDDLMKDFEALVMSTYRKDCQNEGEPYPDAYANMNELERYKFIQNAVKKAPKSVVDVIEQRYREGNVSLASMRAKIDYCKNNGRGTIEDFNTAFQNAEAVRRVHSSRSFLWKIFHPIRNNAEKRDIKYLEDSVQKIIETMNDEGNFLPNSFEVMKNNAIANNSHLERQIQMLDNKIEQLSNPIEQKNNIVEEKIDDLVGENKLEIPENKRLADKNLLKIGYVPDIKNIDKELAEIRQLQQIARQNGWSKEQDVEYESTVRNILSENQLRCFWVQTQLKTKTEEEVLAGIQERKDGYWKNDDESLREKYPNYTEPKILLDKELVVNERVSKIEPIVVNLNEPIAQLSEPVSSTNNNTRVKQNSK